MSATATLPRLPLPRDKVQHLELLTRGLDSASLWWLSGYAAALAGRATLAPDAAVDARVAADVEARLTIIYGSQTGNARRVAEQLASEAEGAGFRVRLVRADAYPLRELAQERLLYVVISTQGDGEPPEDARGFMDFLAGRRAPKLAGLAFAVLGLGDSSYPQFCLTGRKLDARLAELGARRLFDFAAADVDIESVAAPWARQALDSAGKVLEQAPAASNVTPLRPHVEVPAWSAVRPFEAELLANQRITAPNSAKDVRHLELNLAGAGMDYEPGDALGVLPHNPEPLVAAVLETLQLDGHAAVAHADATRPLHVWLTAHRELTRLGRSFVAAVAERSGAAELQALLQSEQGDALRALLNTEQPIDLLQRYPAAWTAEALLAALRPLAPRLYSIASSRAEVGDDEVHLTVAHVEYTTAAGTRWGAASHWLAGRAEGESLEVYLERNERFRLPADPSRDVIMIGPGTGVAPFRAFVQQRAASGASGRNWLFFGNPYFSSDFLYQLEWQAALKAGTLQRLELAFSRDQADKLYVQQRLREHGREVFAWLEGGAHLYVCGATAMASAVEAALREVIIEHGGRSPEAADEYLAALREARRLARDVY